MTPFDLPRNVIDNAVYDGAIDHLRAADIYLPTFDELTYPVSRSTGASIIKKDIDANAPHSSNLHRVHWYNDKNRQGLSTVPNHLLLTEEVTGVAAPILVVLGEYFPMIGAHKVLPAYASLAIRLISGLFDPGIHRAVWPSTGNYCRGGVAISQILGCRGVAVLPEGMSQERFDWLDNWVMEPTDVIRTPGSESNVKEIYDKCAELSKDPNNVILNQFSEFANYLIHYQVTGIALEQVFMHQQAMTPGLSLAAFVAGTGSAGTLAAGDYLKETQGAKIVAVEPTECPTMLSNGYGEHNIQGIGDKHIPLIHNVMNTDIIAGVADKSCDELSVLFNTESGRQYLTGRRGLTAETVSDLGMLGLSGIANVLAAIKVARTLDLGEKDAIVTVATDSSSLYDSERISTEENNFPHGFDQIAAAEVYAQHLCKPGSDNVLELTHREKKRIFNLGYFTWVEQQGIELENFDKRRHQSFWKGLREYLPIWDEMINEFNSRTGLSA
jgi:cysteine synthase A